VPFEEVNTLGGEFELDELPEELSVPPGASSAEKRKEPSKRTRAAKRKRNRKYIIYAHGL
jgi:hypothetical protein